MRHPNLRLIAPRWASALLLLITLLGAAASLSGLRLARDVWQVAQHAAPSAASMRPLRLSVAGEVFAVPADLVRFPPGAAGGSQTVQTARIGLVVGWRRLPGFEAAPGGPGLHLALIAGDDPVSARTRLERIYRPFFEGEEFAGPDGLVGRRLARSSGYGGETLFYESAPADAGNAGGQVFLIRCGSETNSPAPAICLRRLALSPELQVEYRFRKDRLAQWREIDAAVAALIAQFRQRAGR
ncbi:MAG: hypothetical protein Q8P46_03280 [Hyphomicrobiales bacterium]|nr:hypothetical protein [Hyphomicrobiales bacterium]